MADRERAGRGRVPDNRGERHGMAKLTDAQCLAIVSDTRTQRVIAAQYGVNQGQVSYIQRRAGVHRKPRRKISA